MIDIFKIYAKPFPKTCDKKTFVAKVGPIYKTNDVNFTIKGGTFFQLRNVYLSASNILMFDNVTYYNPFSAIKNLSAENPAFYATILPEFTFSENYLYITLPQLPKTEGFFDVIVENEAGYGKLTNSPLLSSGIKVLYY
jgi:hypothetical protein